MKRPPLWAWGLPAAVALGLLMGLRMRHAPAAAPPPAPRDSAASPVQPRSADPTAAVTPAPPVPFELALVPDTATWGMDGGGYLPLDGPAPGDTLPAAPEDATGAKPEPVAAAIEKIPPPEPRPVPRAAEGPAQGLGREAAYARPLIAAVRGGGRLSFYSAWNAPPARASLVGEWARVGACAGTVRLGYEQPVGGLGAVRGVGDAAESPPWDVALVVSRQHCASAASRWRGARAPTAEEQALLAPFFPGDAPAAVVFEGNGIWASSARRAVAARIAGGRAMERWSATAPDGASMRLLGVWEGDGVWVAIENGGRVLRVWRVPG
jgi:hypothetical protein